MKRLATRMFFFAAGSALGLSPIACSSDDATPTDTTGSADAGGTGTTSSSGTTGTRGTGTTASSTGTTATGTTTAGPGTTSSTGTGGASDGASPTTTTGGEGGADGGTGSASSAGDAGSLDARSDATNDRGDAGVTFDSVESIFETRCASCHSSRAADGGMKAPSGNLDFFGGDGGDGGADAIYAALVGQAAGYCADRSYVTSGHPELSYLIDAVTGNFPATTATCTNNNVDGGKPMTRMPLNCVPVTAGDAGDGGVASTEGGASDGALTSDGAVTSDASDASSSQEASAGDGAASGQEASTTDGAAGDAAPRPVPCLTADQVQALTDWIAQGARR